MGPAGVAASEEDAVAAATSEAADSAAHPEVETDHLATLMAAEGPTIATTNAMSTAPAAATSDLGRHCLDINLVFSFMLGVSVIVI